MRSVLLLITIIFSLAFLPAMAQDQPKRVILVIIDGLHTEAPGRLEMSNFSALARKGSLIEKTCGVMPYHPTHGEYAEIHTSSYPNPVMMAGTIFLKPGQEMLQNSFEHSAFIANTSSYQSITDGYQYVIQKSDSDAFAINQAVEILQNQEPSFMRIHLQRAGGAGYQSFATENNQVYKHNIWHEGSPYVDAVEEADRQLGRLVSELKRLEKWEDTLLIVTSDHGQTKTGWHPTLPEESWLFPTLFHGPGIKQDHNIEWADQIDIAPTIAHLMNVPLPNDDGGTGRVLRDIFLSEKSSSLSSSKLLELNRILARYIRAEAEMLTKAEDAPYLNSQVMILERDFYGLDRIMEWRELGSIDSLIKKNEQIVLKMEQTLKTLK